MRAGPLSNAKVVSLLNHYFVPVYVSNEDYTGNGVAPKEEKAEYQRIYREALQAKLSTGTVHAYVLTPDAHPIDSLHVANAANVERLVEMLERSIEKLKPAEGKPLLPPSAQSAAPKAEPDALVLHLTSRYLVRKGNELVPLKDEAGLGKTRNASWSAAPGENWIVLTRAEWSKLLPANKAATGTSWDLDREVTARLLDHFYPATENNDVAKNSIDEHSLKAVVISVQDGVVRARIDGRLKMKHPFYHKDDGNVVEAIIIGYLDFEPAKKSIRALQLTTERATYGRQNFGVAVRTVAGN